MALNLDQIAQIIKKAADDAGLKPGVYKMINAQNQIIYVGKAKYLKNRLMSYTRFNQLSNRTKMMVSNISSVEFIVVNSESESFLLESNLIKQFKPFYNVQLKDDTSFPYIVIDSSHDFPRVFKYRTLRPKGKNFFGPYPAISALNETIKVIQRTFLLRNCTDSYFERRDRPCLQYFIKRCSAPCVNKISKEAYAQNVKLARELLDGRDEVARKALTIQMKIASDSLDFERAALVRDRIKAITEIQSKQFIQIDELYSIDFVALVNNSDSYAVAVTFFRTGKNVGTESFIFKDPIENSQSEILEHFILQFYKTITPPSVIVTNYRLENSNEIVEILKSNYQITPRIINSQQGTYKKIMESAITNAQMKLRRESSNTYGAQVEKLAKLVGIKKINRIEIYDNSHLQGTNACGVMVVFEDGNIQKNKARKFNIDANVANGGDDIQMMRFSLEKRFNSKKIPETPDLIIIDGGKTQVSVACDVLSNFQLREKVKVIGIAKQNNRKMGDEKIVFENGDEKILEREQSDLLSFLIILRNEAHKTAISFHRKRRQKKLTKSILDEISSIGPVRKKLLLEHFGSTELIKNASIHDLKMVKGIDSKTAFAILEFFNRDKK